MRSDRRGERGMLPAPSPQKKLVKRSEGEDEEEEDEEDVRERDAEFALTSFIHFCAQKRYADAKLRGFFFFFFAFEKNGKVNEP